MIGNYALMLTATGHQHVLEHILFLLTHIMCTIRNFSIVILSCPFQRPVHLRELFCLSGLVMLTLKLHRPQHLPFFFSKKAKLSYHCLKNICSIGVSCITKIFFTVVSSAFCFMRIIHGTNIITASSTYPPFLFNEFKASATLTHLSITIGIMVQ